MNRRTEGLLLSEALDGFAKYKVVEGLSSNTLHSYRDQLDRLVAHLGNPLLEDITSEQLGDFLYWLRTDYKPRRVNRDNKDSLSPKTLYNFWVSMKSFFTWAHKNDFLPRDLMAPVAKPRFTVEPIDPFTREEIEQLLHVCKYSRVADTNGRLPFKMKRPTYRRDEALILVLLDTGLRASELCALRITDVNMKTGEVTVRHGKHGGAKGGKGRFVYIGKATRRTLWRYIVEREDKDNEYAPLFLSTGDRPLNKNSLRLLLRRLGKKAGLKKCHPHMFRHTFATNYLRAEGDIFTLQELLGHSSLEMVRRYARIANVDIQRMHSRASPVDNWAL